MTLSAILPSGPFFAGCAAKTASIRRLQRVSAAPAVTVSRPPLRAREDENWIVRLFPSAHDRLQAAGLTWKHPLEIRLHADISSFVFDTGQTSARLRAWTTWSVVHVLPRTTWKDASDAASLARLTHELVHVAVFHAFRTEARAQAAKIPFFWGEGAASVIAQQQRWRMPLDLVLKNAPTENNPLSSSKSSALTYGAAHHAIALLVKREGPGIIHRVNRTAARRGGPGAIAAALAQEAKTDVDKLWRDLRA